MNRTGAGNACIACSTVSFTDSGTDYTTDTSACTATSQTINVAQAVSNGSGSCKQNQTRTGSRNGTRTKTRTCYRTGGAGGTNGASACTGSTNCTGYSYTGWSYTGCSYTGWANSGAAYSCSYSCNSGYYLSGSSCYACSGVSWPESSTDTGYDSGTDTGTDTENITGGTRTRSKSRSKTRSRQRSMSRTCYRTGGAGGTNGSSACTGSNCGAWSYGEWGAWSDWSYGAWSYGAWSYSCDSSHHLVGTECVANTMACAGNLSGATGGNATWNGSGWVYTGCYKDCAEGGIAYGYSYYNGSTWGACRPVDAHDGCHWGYYNNNGESCICAPAGKWAFNVLYTCPAGYFCTGCKYDPRYSGYNGSYTCPAGYTSNEGAGSRDDCYRYIEPGKYWNGTGVETCPAGSYCPGGNMSYGESGSAWGIHTCSGSWSYAGASSCSPCPVDPLDGVHGVWNDTNTSPFGCWKPASTASGLNIGLNAQTTGTANCYWNGTNYALGGANTHGCDAYNITACAAGYYSPNPTGYWGSPCIPVESGYYSPAGNVEKTACTTLGAGYTASDGARSANTNCYQACTKECTPGACATGVNACTHANTTTSGTQHYQGACTAAASNCAQTVTNCSAGYYKNGNSCQACNTLGDKTYGGSANANSAGSGVCYKSCGNSSVSNGYIPPNSGTVYYPMACAYNSANTVCNSGYNLTAGNVCALICGAGVTKIRTGDLVIPLYASKQTAPAIHVNVGGKVCYGNLSAGNAAGALNVNIGGEKYHSVR